MTPDILQVLLPLGVIQILLNAVVENDVTLYGVGSEVERNMGRGHR